MQRRPHPIVISLPLERGVGSEEHLGSLGLLRVRGRLGRISHSPERTSKGILLSPRLDLGRKHAALGVVRDHLETRKEGHMKMKPAPQETGRRNRLEPRSRHVAVESSCP